MLAVDFDIVDGRGAVEYVVGENRGRAGGGEQLLAFFEFTKRYPVVSADGPDRVNGGAFDRIDSSASTEHFAASEFVNAASDETPRDR